MDGLGGGGSALKPEQDVSRAAVGDDAVDHWTDLSDGQAESVCE
jgi:hypothetical protein